MRKVFITLAMCMVVFNLARAKNECNCKSLKINSSSPALVIRSLNNSDLDFVQSFQTSNVRGIKSASYFYCNDDHGFLYVKLHDKDLLYKDVTLKTWFELKFADCSNTYYKKEIKYDFIPQ